MFCFRTKLLDERFPLVVLMGGNRRWPADDEAACRASSIKNGIDLSNNAKW